MNDEANRPTAGGRTSDPPPSDELDEWDRMVAAFRTAAPRGSAPPWLEQKVMAEIEALPERGTLGRLVDWLVRPAPIRVSPLAGGLAAVALTLLIVLAGRAGEPVIVEVPSESPPDPIVYVQFMLDAPTASSVPSARP